MSTLSAKTRRTLTAAVLVVTAASAGFAAPTASAAPPAPVSIQATVTIPNPVFGGVWTLSGAIEDSGSFVRTDLNLTGSFGKPQAAVSAFQAVFVFSGAQGTLTLRLELSFKETGLTGVWQVVSGTGAYERASGHGTSEFVFPSSLSLTGVLAKTT
jgi:hypothetical protein